MAKFMMIREVWIVLVFLTTTYLVVGLFASARVTIFRTEYVDIPDNMTTTLEEDIINVTEPVNMDVRVSNHT
jgi:cell division septal protein FtsQ